MTKQLSWTAQIVLPDRYWQPVEILEATQSEDEAWSPTVQGTIVTPYSPQLAAVDPRQQETVIELTSREDYGRSMSMGDITRSYGSTMAALTTQFGTMTVAQITSAMFRKYDGGTGYLAPYERTHRLLLRERTVDREAGTITFAIASMEAKVHDDANVSTTDTIIYSGQYWSLISIVNWILNRSGLEAADRTYDPDVWTSDGYWGGISITTAPSVANTFKAGQNAWDFLAERIRNQNGTIFARYDGKIMLRALGRRFMYNNWGLADVPQTPPPLVLSSETNLIKASDVLSREDDGYTAAVVTYTWTVVAPDGTSTVNTQIDAYDSGVMPRKVYTETLNQAYPGAGAAQAKLTTLQNRSRPIEVEAVIDLQSAWVGNTVTLDDGRTGIIQKYTLQYPADRMQLTIRQGA